MFLDPNMAPKTEPKSMFLVTEIGLYVEKAENSKISTTMVRKHDF